MNLPIFDAVGYTGCPSDAAKEIKEKAMFVYSLKGSYGAVREYVDYLLATC